MSNYDSLARESGIVFSSGWWVSVEFLRDTHPDMLTLAGQVHLPVEQVADELACWSIGYGLTYGIKVDIDNLEYECL